MTVPSSYQAIRTRGAGILGREISRRDLLRGLGTVGLATLGTVACGQVSSNPSTGGSGAGKKLQLTMFVFLGGDLGVMPREFIAEWQESHPNVEITMYEESNQVGYPKMLSRAETDPDNPLVNFGFFNAQTTEQGIVDQMWTELDYSAMSNATQIRPSMQRGDRVGIGIGADQLGLVHNTEEMPQATDSWSQLWNPANDSMVTFFGFPWYAVYMAAQLNGGSLTNMEPGWQVWQQRAQNIRTLVTSNPQYLNVLASGTAPLTAYFNGTAHQWVRDGAPLTYVPPAEGAVSLPVHLQSVRHQSEQAQEACQEIINEMISPKWCARWAETSIEVPANAAAVLPQEMASLPAFSQETVEALINPDYAVVGQQLTAWTDRWERDVVSGI